MTPAYHRRLWLLIAGAWFVATLLAVDVVILDIRLRSWTGVVVAGIATAGSIIALAISAWTMWRLS